MEGKLKVIQQLSRLRKAVRHKYELLKRGRADTQEVISETFKPVIKPLEKLVQWTENKGNISGTEQVANSFQQLEENENDSQSIGSQDNDQTLVNVGGDDTTLIDESPEDPLLGGYLQMLRDKNKLLDHWYGVRKSRDKRLMIGDSEIKFKNNTVVVRSTSYPKSEGLLELLFKKQPNETMIGDEDLVNYRKILETTSGHKKEWVKNKPLRQLKTNQKFLYIIKPMFRSTKKKKIIGGKGLLPKYKITRSAVSGTLDYVYWDDPNELVDRLKLLIAEQAAGNNAHTNEIHSILEELREAGYIY